MPTITSAQSGNWSAGSTWVGGNVPVNDDSVVIAAGHNVCFDVDTSGFANGIGGLTISGHNTTPGMLYCKYDAPGTYHLKMKISTTIIGSGTGSLPGRLLANSDGVWGNTGALPNDRKFIITVENTSGYINCNALDVNLRCTEPTVKFARGVSNVAQLVTSVDVANNALGFGVANPFALNSMVYLVPAAGAALPAGLHEWMSYWVLAGPDGNSIKLCNCMSYSATTVDLTDAGSGSFWVCNGHTSTSTPTVNVVDDVSADPCWFVGAAVALIDGNGMDSQPNLTLAAKTATTIQLSANVDSIQESRAVVVLVERNIQIRCRGTSAVGVAYAQAGRTNYFGCAIISTQASGTWTRYGTALSDCRDLTVSVINGFNQAWGSGGYGYKALIDLLLCCNTGLNAIVGGLTPSTLIRVNYILGTSYGTQNAAGNLSIGLCLGSDIALAQSSFGCTCEIASGHQSYAIGSSIGCQVNLSFGAQAGYNADFCRFGRATTTGQAFTNSRGTEIAGDVYSGGVGIQDCFDMSIKRGVVLWAWSNGIQRATVTAHGLSMPGTTQVATYQRGTGSGGSWSFVEGRHAAVKVFDLGNVAGALGFWTQGGYCKSAAYAVGTHGTPPVTAPALIHEHVFGDRYRNTWVEIPVMLKAGQQATFTAYGKLSNATASFWDERPVFEIVDAAKPWLVGDVLATSAVMSEDTDWHTFTVTYTPTVDTQAYLRVRGRAASTPKLYWFYTLDLGGTGGGGGGAPLIGSSRIRGMGLL